MLLSIFLFDLQQRLRRISTYVYFAVFFALGCLFTMMSGGALPGASVDFGTGGKVLVNSPYGLNVIITYISFFGIIITAAIAGQATYQDIDNNSAVFFYTAPITKLDYLGGRFLSAFMVQIFIFSSVGLGAWLGTRLPGMDPTRLGPQIETAYLQPYLITVLPNLLFTTAIFFALAALTRKMLPVYVASVLVLIGYFVAGQLSNNLNISVQAALIDPLGGNAIDRIAQYWTPFQRNTRLIPLQGILLANRILWLSVGALFWIVTYLKFSFSYASPKAGRREAALVEKSEVQPALLALPILHQDFSLRASFRQLLSLTRIQFTETTRNIFFTVFMLAGFLLSVLVATGLGDPYSTPTYPVTYQMLQAAGAGFFVFALAIITFYAGELVWRERDAQLNQVVDAFPVQRWVLFTSKLLALMLVQVLVVLVVLAAGLIVQVANGYHRFELGLYFRDLFLLNLPSLWFLCVLALLVQVIVNQKYLGHFVMVLYFVATLALPSLGLEHYLYRFGQSPTFIYSDMNGFGPYVKPLFWFHLYWAIAAVLLAILANLLWVRGTESDWQVRLKLASSRLSRPTLAGAATFIALLFGVGGYIFYNTNIVNPYRTGYQIDESRAQYEKKYRQYLKLPQPRITDVQTQVDLYPEQRGVSLRGTMWLENKTDASLDRVALTVWPADLEPLPRPRILVKHLSLAGGQTAIIEDPSLGFYLYQLPTALPPHGRVQLDFAIQYDNVGFENSRPNTDLVRNGMGLNDRYFPFIGYAPDIELTDDSTRHRHGLKFVKRLATLEDVAARQYNSGSTDADWINLDATVSTSADQIAIMPGYLQKEWEQDGRRYFHYKMDAPILNLYSVQSARYDVRRDRWQNVNLDIYYQPGHEFNLERMDESMKETLAYCSTNFSPFQFHQLRIIEFPRYARFAASYANTIPFSESIGFITKVGNKADSMDVPFYVTAHETAHQWWAHQVISAYVEGATSIDETLAQYTAMMVMKQHYGPESMKLFLRYELDRYLRGRGTERNEEKPLYRVEPNQGYIHYAKGSLVMYALQDDIGEDKVNQALAAFIKDYAFKGPPYPTSLDLMSHLKKVTPSEFQYLYEDLFENITLYDDRAISADYLQQADGKYQVYLVVEAKKLRADGRGQEHAVPLHDWLDIGVLDSSGHYLYLQKHKVEQEKTELTLTVDKAPAQAGIDPLNKLIDRNPQDNIVAVKRR
ncbi:MAG TPA: M1 family aminopeptidase [Terriglobales bacterium]|jgi:ABC-2 type transport system permease protein